jgi:acetyl-CoA acyltransferase 1
MLTPVLKATIERTKIDPKLIGDVVVGTVLGVKANEARISCLLAGLPDTVPVHVLNRQCSSGLQAIATVAANILAGNYEIGIGAGCETMTRYTLRHSLTVYHHSVTHWC